LPKTSLQTNCPKLAPEISQKNSAAFALLDSLYTEKTGSYSKNCIRIFEKFSAVNKTTKKASLTLKSPN